MAVKRMDADVLIRMLADQEHPLLSNLPHNPINLEEKLGEVRRKVRKGERFSLKDVIPKKGYTLDTSKIADRQYVTVVLDIELTGACMPPHQYKTLDSLHTRSMKDAIQLHYDALGHLGK